MTTNERTHALSDLALLTDDEAVLDVLLEGWSDDYRMGRRHLLERLHAFKSQQDGTPLDESAERAYESLIRFGEDLADMRWVHLAVECRDVLKYGFVYVYHAG